MNKRTTRLCLAYLAITLITSACAGAREGHDDTAAQRSKMLSSLDRGQALMNSGNYLIACPYLEASLAQGEDEKTVLPILAGAQIRAGRLLAAQRTMRRLVKISPDHPHAKELLQLLKQLLSGSINEQKEERI